MSNASKFRKKAVEYEQLKQFDRAVASYVRAIEENENANEEVDVALFNKVGDLTLRQGRVTEAVTYYERAVEHYVSNNLFDNAIALCNKILRNAPGRSNVYFTLGRICGRKGLRSDATRNFLAYATRMQEEGRVDEGMRALAEVADLMPELTEVGRLVEEHAARAGISLAPRRRATPPATNAQPASEPSRMFGLSKDLVFLQIDYEAAQQARGKTPPPQRYIVDETPVSQASGITPAHAVAASANAAARGTPIANASVPPANARGAATPVTPPPVTRTARLEDLMIFDPNERTPGTADVFGDDDVTVVDGASILKPYVDTSAPVELLNDLQPTELTAVPLQDDLGFVSTTAAVTIEAPELEVEAPEPFVTPVDVVAQTVTLPKLAVVTEEVASEENEVPKEADNDDGIYGNVSMADDVNVLLPDVPEFSEPSTEAALSADVSAFADISAEVHGDSAPEFVAPDSPAFESEPEFTSFDAELTEAGAIELTPADNLVVDAPTADAEVVEAAGFGEIAPEEVIAEEVVLAEALLAEAVVAESAGDETVALLPDSEPELEALVVDDFIHDVVVDTAADDLVVDSVDDLVVDSVDDLAVEVADDLAVDGVDDLAVDVVDDFAVDVVDDLATDDSENVAPDASGALANDVVASSDDMVFESADELPEFESAGRAESYPALETIELQSVESTSIDLLESLDAGREPFAESAVADDVEVGELVNFAVEQELNLSAPAPHLDGFTPDEEPATVGDLTDVLGATGDFIVEADADETVDASPAVSADLLPSLDFDAMLDLDTDVVEPVADLQAEDFEAATDELAVSRFARIESETQAPLADEFDVEGELPPLAASLPETTPTTANVALAEVELAVSSVEEERGPIDLDEDMLGDLFIDSAVPTAVAAAEATLVASSRCAELQSASDAEPNNFVLRRRLAEALFESGDRDAALAELGAALAIAELAGNLPDAADVSDELVRVDVDQVTHHQKRLELAIRTGDQTRLRAAYLDFADALVRQGEELRARAVYARVLEIDPWDDRARTALGDAAPPPPAPVAPKGSDDSHVNLADWLRDEDEPVSTRLRMREPDISGDEQEDFNSLLRQFKEGVARSLGEDDYESHYDLGVAYKEMGLLDDAIGEFQMALRSKSNRLAAYEALGQCFLEQQSYKVAVTVLSRALHEPAIQDEQRVGVLYLLGYSCEVLQRFDEARGYFQRVYATDIHFRDVAQRLAALDRTVR